jgi:hypothetical protein
MAFLQIDVQRQLAGVGTKAQRNAALRKAFQWIGEQWHQRYKMKKFRESAMQEYGLDKRTPRYNRRKKRRAVSQDGSQAVGEVKPFVWSGRSRSSAQASRKVVAKAVRGFGHADCIITAPALNFTPKGGRIKLRSEFERVTVAEIRDLERDGILIYENEITASRGTSTRFRS